MDDKFLKDLPEGDYPLSREYPKDEELPINDEKEPQKEKKPRNRFVRFLHWLFVKNIALKLLALGGAALMWVLVVGLG